MYKILILLSLMLCLTNPVFAQQQVPILVYHSIDEFKGQGLKELFVTPENFEKQVRFLKDNGYTLLTFENWKDLSKVKKPIFITFDDGYKNNLNAHEIFQKLKDTYFQPAATIFVISDFIGWPNRLTNSDLVMLANSGMFSIQSHTATHPDLTKNDNLEYELKGAKQKIEKITGKPVIALAYPFGSFNKEIVKKTKKFYDFGLTTTPGLYSKQNIVDERYYLPRIYVKYSMSLEDFREAITK